MKTVRVGVMPGRINEYALEVGTPIADVIALAELEVDGYDVKIDGEKVTDLESAVVTSSTNLILLVKQVKGNSMRTVRIGVMPGRINEYALDSETTFAEALQIAELDVNGYEVKADGSKITDLNQAIGSTNLILLAKQVKGN